MYGTCRKAQKEKEKDKIIEAFCKQKFDKMTPYILTIDDLFKQIVFGN